MDEKRVFELAKKVAHCEKINNMLVSDMDSFKNNVMYEVTDERVKNNLLEIPKIASCEETLDELLHNKKSICRFGDGEFACISENFKAKFTETYSQKLADRLVEVLHSNDENKIIMARQRCSYGRRRIYKVSIPYKYVNEILGGENVEYIGNEKYESEIKVRIL